MRNAESFMTTLMAPYFPVKQINKCNNHQIL